MAEAVGQCQGVARLSPDCQSSFLEFAFLLRSLIFEHIEIEKGLNA